MSLQKDYENLAKGNKNMPSWKWIEDNFNIKKEEDFSSIEQIRGSLIMKIESLTRLIDPMVASAQFYSAWIQTKMFNKQEKEEMVEVYKRLQSLLWASSKVGVSRDEKDYQNFFIKIKEEWEYLKPIIVRIFGQIEVGWKNYKKAPDSKTYYHG
jgi:hypothetical protein